MNPNPTLAQADRCFRAGDFARARTLANAAPPSPITFLILSRIETESGAHRTAWQLADRGVALDPSNAACLSQRGFAALHCGDRAAAEQDAEAVLALTDVPMEALDLAGVIFHALGVYVRAADAIGRAAALDPRNSALQTNLGAVRVICGDLGGAEDAYRRAIALDPTNPRALAALSEVRAAGVDDNNIPAIRSAIAATRDVHGQLVLHHALARELESIGDVPAAFAALQHGKAVMAAAKGYNPSRDRDMFAALMRTYARPPGRRGAQGRGAIFVLGMPRSGTTVMERMLTGLDGVTSIGESPLLAAAVRRSTGSNSPAIADAALLERQWQMLDMAAIGRGYLTSARHAAKGSAVWIDKLPLNLLLAGIVVHALPDARIIWLEREAMDATLGNYRQMFEYQTGNYDFGLSLPATAEFTADAMALRQYLAANFRRQIIPVDYAELVRQPEETGRMVAAFCGLSWRPEAVAIDRNASPAGSASAVQVRAPINDRHVGRSKTYGDLLEPAAAVFFRRSTAQKR